MTDANFPQNRKAAESPLYSEKPIRTPAQGRFFESIDIADDEFEEIRALVHRHFGISLTPKKKFLVENRLQKVIKSMGMCSFRQYIEHLKRDLTGEALAELSNRITTNHTFFFRESGHFEFFTDTVLPAIKKKAILPYSKKFRMWCAGCSFGDEPYSFAISLLEFFGSDCDQWKTTMLATDISMAALIGAKTGIYPEDRLKLVPPQLKEKYFTRLPDGAWHISDPVRRRVSFDRINFIAPVYPVIGRFHIISCRNVMIYFDQETREKLIERFYDYTEPGGYLFIGHSETLPRDNPYFRYVRPAIYQKIER